MYLQSPYCVLVKEMKVAVKEQVAERKKENLPFSCRENYMSISKALLRKYRQLQFPTPIQRSTERLSSSPIQKIGSNIFVHSKTIVSYRDWPSEVCKPLQD